MLYRFKVFVRHTRRSINAWLQHDVLGVSEPSVGTALSLSGAALTTEGFLAPNGGAQITLYIIGLGIVALLITFLPTIYSIYSQREQEVSDQRRRRKCVRPSGKETHAVKVGFQVR